MQLFLDLFGYLSVLLRGLGLIVQSVAIGSLAFLLLIARPLANEDASRQAVLRSAILILRIAGWTVAILAVVRLAVQLAALIGASGIPLDRALGANFVVALSLQVACGIALALLAGRAARPGSDLLLALCCAGILASAVMTSHATGRLEGRGWLLLGTSLHQLGAGIWIGGLPALLVALALLKDGRALAFLGRRYSTMAVCSVGALLAGAAILVIKLIGSGQALYGTAYGFMTMTKMALFAMLIGLGAGNFFLVRRLNRDPSTPVLRFRRFVEVELGLAVAVLLAAASLTSVPPGIDIAEDQLVSWREIVDRNWPIKPTWTSPKYADLSLSRLETELGIGSTDVKEDPRAQAFVPGSGVRLQRTVSDRLWSAFNHNWSGVFVLASGLLALLNRFGVRWGRNWPLVFFGLAVFIFIRADADAWPLGSIGFWESFRDPETLQHRSVVPMIGAIGLFEWSVQTGRLRSKTWDCIFPLMCVAGGLVLLTHSHTIDSAELLLIEMSHSIMAMLALVAGWARWLEVRTEESAVRRAAAWIWPVCLVLVGVTLIAYREM